MALYEQWQSYAAANMKTQEDYNQFWAAYLETEKGIYEQLLETKEAVTGTVKELADKYEVTPIVMAGFLDGINESLKTPNNVDALEEDTPVSLDYDLEKLYYNMVGAKAEWLYELPQWDSLLSKERREELYKEEKKSHTIVKAPKIGRNDPCPCGSGKKYKKCCGK